MDNLARKLFDETRTKLDEKLRGLGYTFEFEGTGPMLMMTVREAMPQLQIDDEAEWKVVAMLDAEQGVIWNIQDGLTVDDKLLGMIRRGFQKLCGYWLYMEHETLIRLNAGEGT